MTDRCGWYEGMPRMSGEVIQEVTGMGTINVGDDLMCTYHAAKRIGVSEDRLARLALVRSDFFDVHSVETFAEEGCEVSRDRECDAAWYGRCLWGFGLVVLWLHSADDVEAYLNGAPVEGSFSDVSDPAMWMA